MLIALIAMVVLVALHYLVVTARQGWISAESLAVLSMSVMMVGYVLLPRDVSFEPFLTYSVVCYCACILGMIVMAGIRRPEPRHARPIPPELLKPTRGMVLALVAAGLVTVAYYAAAGGLPFLAGLQNVFLGADNNIRDLRLSTYKGDQYLAPGYVNQFKNVIFPALAAVAGSYLWSTRRLSARIATVLLAVAAVFAVFGTGQRTFGVLFAGAIVGAFSLTRGGFQRRTAIRGGAAFLAVFILATAALGRSSAAAAEAPNVTGTLAVYVGEAIGRFFNDQQSSALLAEQVVDGWRIPFLSDWWGGLVSYLPGQSSGNSISGAVGAYYTGGSATTMPPSSVTSARVNLGQPGAVIFFFLWGMLLALVSRILLAAKGGSPLYFIGSAGVMVVLGSWVADSPFTLLQQGLVAFLVLAIIGSGQYKRFLSRQAEPTHRSRANGNPRRRTRAPVRAG